MNKREEIKINCYLDVIDVIETLAKGVQITTALSRAKDALRTICSDIMVIESQLKNTSPGSTETKDNCTEEIVDSATVIAGALFAYAAAQNNVELEKFADLLDKDIMNSHEKDISVKVKTLLDKADAIGAALEDFGVTRTEMDKLKSALINYNEKVIGVNKNISSRITEYDELVSLFNRADKNVEVIDRLMKKYENTYPEFYTRFIAAKNIKNKAVWRRAIETEE